MISFLKTPRARYAALALLVIVGLGSIGVTIGTHQSAASMPKEGNEPTEFVAGDLTTLQPRSLAQTLAINGTLQATRQAVVKAKLSVDVKEVLVREGDPVRAGQVLAQLDTRDLEARLADKTGARESAQAQFDLAQKNRTTNQALLDKSFISQNAFDSTDSTFRANRASLDAADAQLQQVRIALRDATVVAPISGIIAKRYMQAGDKASLDAPLFTIVDLDSLEMQAPVPAGEVGGLARGMPATLNVDGMSGNFAARLDRVSPATEAGTLSILVFLSVPNPGHLLKSGMFANGTLRIADSQPAASLPINAVQTEAGQPIVWTIEGGKITRHTVTVGRRDEGNGFIEIKSGVPAGMPVLASKFDTIKEGSPAVIKTPAAAVTPPPKKT